MKKILLLSLAAAGVMQLAAQTNVIDCIGAKSSSAKMTREYTASKPAKAPAKASSSDFDPYYPAPDGVLYLGLQANGKTPPAEYALVPNYGSITFKSGFSDGDYTWDYYTDGGANKDDIDNADLVIGYTGTKVVSSPSLYCVGYGGRGSYSMARDGLAVGYGSVPTGGAFEYYGSNINSAELKAQFYDPATLSVNYEAALAALSEYYSDSKVTVTSIKGFGELFSYSSAYALDNVRADVVYADGTVADPSHLVAEIYPFDKATGVDFSNKIATFAGTSVTKHDDYFYCFDFAPEAAPTVTTPVMVIIRPTEGTTNIISPAIYVSETFHEADPGSAYMYCSYKFGSSEVADGCLGYNGVEMRSYGRTMYHNHWNVGIKRTYIDPAGAASVAVDAASAITYNAATRTATCPGASSMAVVSMQGSTIATADGESIDLGNVAPCIYIVTANVDGATAAVKVATN